MNARIQGLVPNARNRIRMTTFHSFCVDLLRQHGHHIGLRPDFNILPQDVDREAVLDEAIEEVRRDQPEVSYRGQQLLPVVNRLLDNCVPPDGAFEELSSRNVENAQALAAMYASYRRSMIENNQLDFGCLIAEALALLERNPNIRRLINRIYPYACVDEFQDTNLAQYRILSYLVNPATKNLFVVADDDQIIYQWNGADPRRLRALREDFGVTVLQLPENYRRPPSVVDAASEPLNKNGEGFSGGYRGSFAEIPRLPGPVSRMFRPPSSLRQRPCGLWPARPAACVRVWAHCAHVSRSVDPPPSAGCPVQITAPDAPCSSPVPGSEPCNSQISASPSGTGAPPWP